jgi:hypothetical protein
MSKDETKDKRTQKTILVVSILFLLVGFINVFRDGIDNLFKFKVPLLQALRLNQQPYFIVMIVAIVAIVFSIRNLIAKDKKQDRNHLQILKDIEKAFDDYGLEEEKQQLEYEIAASATGGELCMRTCSKLLTLQKESKTVNTSAAPLIRELLVYCNRNGLYPKPRR